MPPPRAQCQICSTQESKYTCSACKILYCSIACYRQHKDKFCSKDSDGVASSKSVISQESHQQSNEPAEYSSFSPTIPHTRSQDPEQVADASSLRLLSTLNWPYVPDQSAYPDPLKRDDPKPLQLHQYEMIATSPAIRRTLSENPRLIGMLASLDTLKGSAREDAIRRALGVHESQMVAGQQRSETEEDVGALRKLTEAIEAAVRGEKEGTVDFDWGD